ncbi:MAG: regulatory iron-sulfur-containing complex subunit RicT [Rikenellaceae bacterium]
MSCRNCKCRPNIGRGASFCHDNDEIEATIHEGCYKLHETNYLADFPENFPSDIIEIRFKNTRRSYYQNVNKLDLKQGDIVAVEASPGHDIGVVSMMGDMVAKQMRRVGFNPLNGEYKKIYRKAKPYDIEKWQEAIELEHETMILSRQIAADMGLNMKIGDVEYQGDKIKAIFYYIADERVDFRELIKVFADRFHIRIEMKQIGARQEAGRIGGLGACGRELCCASWIANFSSVTTNAARTQEMSLNPLKLAGQCSKLKCCLTYEYDTYVDARKEFPRLREPLQAVDGEYHLIKSDILAGTMVFSSSRDAMANVVVLPIDRVKEIISMNRAGKKVDKLQREEDMPKVVEEPTYRSEEGDITRFDSKRRPNKSNNRNRNRNKPQQPQQQNAEGKAQSQQPQKQGNNSNNNRPRRDRVAKVDGGQRQQADNANQTPRPPRPERTDRPNRNNRSRQGGGNNPRGEGKPQQQAPPKKAE